MFDAIYDGDCDALIQGVASRFQPIFYRYNEEERRAVYRYLFSQRPMKSPPSLLSRLIRLYNSMADRSRHFPDELRWCLNSYVGCGYCHVNGYSQEGVGNSPHPKQDFKAQFDRDLESIRELGVPIVPLHISNSTDPLLPCLEKQHRHTLFALTRLVAHQDRFSSVVLLTQYPGLLVTDPYKRVITRLKRFTVQVICAFWQEQSHRFWEPTAPPIKQRLAVLRELARSGIAIDLRVDSLFPVTRIDEETRYHSLPEFGLAVAQSPENLKRLVRSASELEAKIVLSVLNVPISNEAEQSKERFGHFYTDTGNRKVFRVLSVSVRAIR